MKIIRPERSQETISNVSPSDTHTILGPASSFDGKLTFTGAVRIDGKFKGEIHTDDSLVIGESAEVEASVFVGGLILNGLLRGNVHAKGVVELTAPARLYGDIETHSLVIQRGALFEGSCRMENLGEKPSVLVGDEKKAKKDAAQDADG